MTNFTFKDLVSTAIALIAFSAVLFCPGYLLALAAERLGFARRSRAGKAAWAVGLSFAVSPLLVYFGCKVFSVAWTVDAFRVVAAVATVLLVSRRILSRTPWTPTTRSTRWLCLLLAVATAIVFFELVDLQIHGSLYQSVTILDQAYRVAFADAVARTGVPPANPLFYPGHASPLRYYYFWNALCAVCMRLGGVTARQAFIASCAWSGLGLVAAIALFVRHFLDLRNHTRRYVLLAALLLTVTGLDLFPVAADIIFVGFVPPDPEWWAVDQVSSWLDTVLWVPNHLSALVCCMASFLLLWHARRADRAQAAPQNRARRQLVLLLAAAVAAGSGFGLSIYVGFGFSLLVLAWLARLVVVGREWSFAARACASLALAGVLASPFFLELQATTSGTQALAATGAAHVFALGVRAIINPVLVTQRAAFLPLDRAHPHLLDLAVRLVLLIPGYIIEFGVFGLVLALCWRRRRQLDEARRTALFLTVVGLVIITFIRSAVIGNNDFGYRAAMFPSIFLLLLGVEELERLWRAPRRRIWRLAVALIVVGFSGTVFQAVVLRGYLPYGARNHLPGLPGLAPLALAQRTAYAGFGAPAGARVQGNPTDASDFLALGNLLYSGRPMVVAPAEDCGSAFGGDPARCAEMRPVFHELFTGKPHSAQQAREVCRRYGADYLVVTQRDPAWDARQGWAWTLPLASSGQDRTTGADAVRILDCR